MLYATGRVFRELGTHVVVDPALRSTSFLFFSVLFALSVFFF